MFKKLFFMLMYPAENWQRKYWRRKCILARTKYELFMYEVSDNHTFAAKIFWKLTLSVNYYTKHQKIKQCTTRKGLVLASQNIL